MEKLINVKKLKKIIEGVIEVFDKEKLSTAEVEFVITELRKMSRIYARKREKRM